MTPHQSALRLTASPLVNADQIAFGIFRKNCALILSLFLAIHKVFLRKSAFIRTQFFSKSALADLIIVYSRGSHSLVRLFKGKPVVDAAPRGEAGRCLPESTFPTEGPRPPFSLDFTGGRCYTQTVRNPKSAFDFFGPEVVIRRGGKTE